MVFAAWLVDLLLVFAVIIVVGVAGLVAVLLRGRAPRGPTRDELALQDAKERGEVLRQVTQTHEELGDWARRSGVQQVARGGEGGSYRGRGTTEWLSRYEQVAPRLVRLSDQLAEGTISVERARLELESLREEVRHIRLGHPGSRKSTSRRKS
jgi:hypothetical protein